MDPNAALERIRALLANCDGDGNLDGEDTRELTELVQGLDGWLTNGGFLPEAWSES